MPGPVRFVDADEATRVFPPIYDAVRVRTPGSLARSELKWRWNMVHDAEWMRGGNGAKSLALLEVDGEPRAYAIYRIKADWDNRGPRNILSALEVVGVDPVAEQAMWQWLFRIDLLAVGQGVSRPRAASADPPAHGTEAPGRRRQGRDVAADPGRRQGTRSPLVRGRRAR